MKFTRLIAALAIAVLVTPAFATPVKAASTLVKGSGPATYFVADDGKRYVFPDAQTYFSWYPNFNGVQVLKDADLASIPFGGVVTMRPGVKLVKIKTDPKVYAVARFGTLRWLTSESIAKMIYGEAWAKNVVDIPDAQFANYMIGGDVTGPGQYWWKLERDNAPSISANVRPRTIAQPAPGATLASSASMGQLRFEATIVNDGSNGAFNRTDADIRLFVDDYPDHRVDNRKTISIKPGNYTVYRTTLQGYRISEWGGDCSPQGYVAVTAGKTSVCKIAYSYSADAAKLPRLKIVHTVKNDDPRNGALPGDFQMFIDGMVVKNDTFYDVSPGTRQLVISKRTGYTTYAWSGDCEADGKIYLELGEEKTCTIFSDDNDKDAHVDALGELVLNATVKGGTLKASDVKLFIEGQPTQSGKINYVDPRDYTVYVGSHPGYVASEWGGDCTASGTVGLTVNQLKTCTVTLTAN